VLEIPLAGHVVEAAVLVPGKAVERADEAIGAAIFGAQLAPAMQADIVHGADRAIVLPRNQEAAPGVFIDDIVARIGQVFLARGELPHARPHPLALQPGEMLAGIARGGNRVLPRF
jgi:hypothetical protein